MKHQRRSSDSGSVVLLMQVPLLVWHALELTPLREMVPARLHGGDTA